MNSDTTEVIFRKKKRTQSPIIKIPPIDISLKQNSEKVDENKSTVDSHPMTEVSNSHPMTEVSNSHPMTEVSNSSTMSDTFELDEETDETFSEEKKEILKKEEKKEEKKEIPEKVFKIRYHPTNGLRFNTSKPHGPRTYSNAFYRDEM